MPMASGSAAPASARSMPAHACARCPPLNVEYDLICEHQMRAIHRHVEYAIDRVRVDDRYADEPMMRQMPPSASVNARP
jgi:hypothetical protein